MKSSRMTLQFTIIAYFPDQYEYELSKLDASILYLVKISRIPPVPRLQALKFVKIFYFLIRILELNLIKS